MKHYKLLIIGLVAVAATIPGCTTKNGGSKPQQTPAMAGGDEIVAYLHGEPITAEEVDSRVMIEIMKLREQEYETRLNALNELVDGRLLEAEAAKRDITLEQLLQTEVIDKVSEPSQEEIEKFYNAFRSDATIRGKSLEESQEIIKRSLKQKKITENREAMMEDLYASADYTVTMRPPRVKVPVPEGEPSKGPESAPITIVEFSDFQCGYCKRVEATVDQLMDDYGDKIRVIYRDFPLRNHFRAEPAAIAARCAGDQGKYWDYHANLFQVSGNMSDDDLKMRAEGLGLDMAAFSGCFDEEKYLDAVRLSFAHGSQLGIKGTPTFFINGRRLTGAKPIGDFKAIIDQELELMAEGS